MNKKNSIFRSKDLFETFFVRKLELTIFASFFNFGVFAHYEELLLLCELRCRSEFFLQQHIPVS